MYFLHPLSQYSLMVWCLVKHRDNFTFTFFACILGVAKLQLLNRASSFSITMKILGYFNEVYSKVHGSILNSFNAV
jgi:hypothetical protein